MNVKKILVSIVVSVLVLSPIARVTAYDQTPAQNYLQNHQGTPWVTMALASLGVNNLSTDYLKNINETSAIKYEAPILAITSLGQDPRTFGANDYIAKLKSFYTAGQIGDSATLNDDIFGILALVSSGLTNSDTVVEGSKSFLLAHQNNNGGWGFATPGDSSADMTAAAITALISAGTPASDSHIQNAVNFLKTCQNNDGGFTSDPNSLWGTDSDSSTTAWVMWGLNAINSPMSSWIKSGHTPADFLSANQDPAGFFAYQNGNAANSLSPDLTGQALLALTGKTLPLKTVAASLSSNINFRIEGSQNTVCSGQVMAITAMDIIKNSSTQCGFTYDIKSTSFGPYLDQINSDTASGNTGWIFMDNYIPLQAGAADYQVKAGDDFLIFFGNFNWQPTRLDLPATSSAAGQSITATVEYFDGSHWFPLLGDRVYFGADSVLTDANGHANISAPDGYYQVFGQKDGYVRSNTILLKVGNPSTSSVSLTANFSGGQVAGTSTQPILPGTLSFTVDSSSLDFGNLSPGSQAAKTLHVQNSSGQGITLSASVSGDGLFTNNLWLAGKFWQSFSANLTDGQNLSLAALLKIPAGFNSGSGQKTGQLVLWATAQ